MCSVMSNTSAALSLVANRLRATGSLFAEDEARLLVSAARTRAELESMLDERAAGVPIEHVVGWAEFCGLRIAVEPGVFVPRPRTRFLVRQAASLVRPGAVVVDLCTGAGAVAAAIEAAADVGELYATDVDAVAVRCAGRNIGVDRVFQGDLFEPLPESIQGMIDIAVANVPYVPSGELERLPREARLHEPRHALDGGADGLDVVRRAAAEARGWLASGSHLLVETSERQAPTAAEIFAGSGLRPSIARSDDLDATVVVGAVP